MRSRILLRILSVVGFCAFSSLAFGSRGPCTTFTGKASWYGPGFQNLRTASGTIFDQNELTAASRTLPFHSWVTVTYNGRSVPVEITDRGPYIKGRIIDLSKRAAVELGMKKVGVALVTIDTCLLLPEEYVETLNAFYSLDEG